MSINTNTSQTDSNLTVLISFILFFSFVSLLVWFCLNKLLAVCSIEFTIPLMAVFCGLSVLGIISFLCFYLPLFFITNYYMMQTTITDVRNYKVLLNIMFEGFKQIQDKQTVNIEQIIEKHIQENYVEIEKTDNINL